MATKYETYGPEALAARYGQLQLDSAIVARSGRAVPELAADVAEAAELISRDDYMGDLTADEQARLERLAPLDGPAPSWATARARRSWDGRRARTRD